MEGGVLGSVGLGEGRLGGVGLGCVVLGGVDSEVARWVAEAGGSSEVFEDWEALSRALEGGVSLEGLGVGFDGGSGGVVVLDLTGGAAAVGAGGGGGALLGGVVLLLLVVVVVLVVVGVWLVGCWVCCRGGWVMSGFWGGGLLF